MLAACYLPQPPLTEVGDIFCRVICKIRLPISFETHTNYFAIIPVFINPDLRENHRCNMILQGLTDLSQCLIRDILSDYFSIITNTKI